MKTKKPFKLNKILRIVIVLTATMVLFVVTGLLGVWAVKKFSRYLVYTAAYRETPYGTGIIRNSDNSTSPFFVKKASPEKVYIRGHGGKDTELFSGDYIQNWGFITGRQDAELELVFGSDEVNLSSKGDFSFRISEKNKNGYEVTGYSGGEGFVKVNTKSGIFAQNFLALRISSSNSSYSFKSSPNEKNEISVMEGQVNFAVSKYSELTKTYEVFESNVLNKGETLVVENVWTTTKKDTTFKIIKTYGNLPSTSKMEPSEESTKQEIFTPSKSLNGTEPEDEEDCEEKWTNKENIEVLNCWYAKDSSSIYKRYEYCHPGAVSCDTISGVLTTAYYDTFEILYGKYAKDKNKVFYQGGMILEADPESFKVVSSDVGVDNNNAFYKKNKLFSVDVDTFSVITNKIAIDSRNVYYIDTVTRNGSSFDNSSIVEGLSSAGLSVVDELTVKNSSGVYRIVSYAAGGSRAEKIN